MPFHLTSRVRLEALAGGLLLLAGCTFPEETAPRPEPRRETRPASETLPAPAPAAEPVPEPVLHDNCPACGLGHVSTPGKLFLDAYSAQKS